MKWSQFSFKVEKDNHILLYNTFNSAVVKLEKQRFYEIDNDIKLNLETNSTIIKNLMDMEYIISDSVNEKSQYLNALKDEYNANTEMCINILPTTGCNFDCVYCYQSGIEKKYNLTSKKAQELVDYIANYVLNKNLTKITNVFYGGEPTTNWDIVVEILEKLDLLYKKNNIKYNTQIVTNGYLLTDEKVDILSNYNWNRLQITLDGVDNIHDERRKLINGDKTFEKIISNLKYILDNDKIDKICLRINYDKKNIDEIPSLLGYIKENFDINRITLSMGFVSKTIENTSANNYVVENGIKIDNIRGQYLKLYKKALELGFEMNDIFMFDGMCISKLNHTMLISPDGNIYKCLSGVGRDEFIEGNINRKQERINDYLFLELYDECFEKKCEFIPLCNTGCRFSAYLENKSKCSIDCKRNLLIDINKSILELRYLNI